MNLSEYARTLDKRQRASKKLRVDISNEDKTTHFVGCAQHSKIFEDEWTQMWEATVDRDWTVVRDIWVKKYGEVTSATMMAAKRGCYELAAALRSRRAPPPRPPRPQRRLQQNTTPW